MQQLTAQILRDAVFPVRFSPLFSGDAQKSDGLFTCPVRSGAL